ncbi:MAG: restriction endonuclease subunit S [Chloroflexota bacterium]
MLRNDWTTCTLGDIAGPEKGSVVSGPFGSNIGKRFFIDQGVPLIRGNNLSDMDKPFTDAGFVFISPEKAEELRKCQALPGDLVFTAAGTLGQVGLIPPDGRYPSYIISNKQMRVRLDPSRADPRFAYHWFAAPSMRRYIAEQNKGSSVPLITLGILRSLPVLLPPLATQHKIAAILSAYDDLIENNTRRITILEEMAQRIYREWFVDFRYPGHEGVPLVDSELGLIPEGWRVCRTSDVIAIDPKTAVPRDTAVPFVPMTSVSETTMHIHALENRTNASGSRFTHGDTLFARITPCLENGKTGHVSFLAPGQVAMGSTEFIVLRPRILPAEFVYLLARSQALRGHAIKSMSGATGRQRVRRETFDSYLLPMPPSQLLSRFSDVMRPVFGLSRALFQAANALRTTRDLLLPRLISGEIDVESLDIDTSGLAA